MHRRVLPLLALLLPAASAAATAPALTPGFVRGASYGTMFSRAIAVRVPGFDEEKHRTDVIYFEYDHKNTR